MQGSPTMTDSSTSSNTTTTTRGSTAHASGPFIRGIGSAIPGIGDPRIKDGNGGTLIHVSDVCGVLKDGYDIHNPQTGKRMDREWAKRNLGIETLSCANIDYVREVLKQGKESGVTIATKISEDAVGVTEDELGFIAFEEALERGNLQASDIDVILRVSPTLNNVYFWEGMREWKRKYPGLKEDVQLQHHPIGCPAFLLELKLARQLLCSPEVNNVAIVISNCGTLDVDEDFIKLHAGDNMMKKWVNLTIFGDGASACIVSTDTVAPMPKMIYDLVDIDYKTNNEEWVSTRTVRPAPTKSPVDGKMSPSLESLEGKTTPVFQLNVNGPKLIKGSLDHWTKQLKRRHSDFSSLAKADHVALHTANPKVLGMLAK